MQIGKDLCYYKMWRDKFETRFINKYQIGKLIYRYYNIITKIKHVYLLTKTNIYNESVF